MSDPVEDIPKHTPTLTEVSARRLAAKTQWQRALARAKERFQPANIGNELVDKAADAVGSAADKAASTAWTHRWKLAAAGLLGGLFFARKPITHAAAPLAEKARTAATRARQNIVKRTKR